MFLRSAFPFFMRERTFLRPRALLAALAIVLRAGAQPEVQSCSDGVDGVGFDARLRARRAPSPWRVVSDADGELWADIAAQDAADYDARHRLQPGLITTPVGCEGQVRSVCGVWGVASRGAREAATCVDLCLGTEFLPPLDALERSEAAAEAAAEAADAEKFQQLLFRTQFPAHVPEGAGAAEALSTGSEDARALRPAAAPLSGFGVTMVYAAHNLVKAVTAQRVWAPSRRSLDVWTSESWCGPERHLGCYFLAPTNRSWEVTDAAGTARSLDAEREGLHAGIDGIMHDFAPPEFAHRGAFWVHAQSLLFIWQLNQRTDEYLRKVREEMARRNADFVFPLQHPTIGMHIRRGDSFMAARWMPGLESFLVPARRIKVLECVM